MAKRTISAPLTLPMIVSKDDDGNEVIEATLADVLESTTDELGISENEVLDLFVVTGFRRWKATRDAKAKKLEAGLRALEALAAELVEGGTVHTSGKKAKTYTVKSVVGEGPSASVVVFDPTDDEERLKILSVGRLSPGPLGGDSDSDGDDSDPLGEESE